MPKKGSITKKTYFLRPLTDFGILERKNGAFGGYLLIQRMEQLGALKVEYISPEQGLLKGIMKQLRLFK